MKWVISLSLFLPPIIALVSYIYMTLPSYTGTHVLLGVDEDILIDYDSHGIPHIRASTNHDAFFALGYLHAQNRLWQINFLRRLSSGTLSALIGEEALEIDKIMRNIGFRREATRTYNELSPKAKLMFHKYCEGINSYVAEGNLLPLEFTILGEFWVPWHPIDSIAIKHLISLGLTTTWAHEILRTKLISKIGYEKTRILIPFEEDLQRHETHIVSEDEVPEELRGPASPPKRSNSTVILEEILTDEIYTHASNAWVISGKFTQSGKPILASDPHLDKHLATSFYMADLRIGNSVHIAGATLPGIPFFAIGRNEYITWAVTALYPDVVDLYIEKRNPENSNQYLYKGTWHNFDTVTEHIDIKGKSSVKFDVEYSRHGPILHKFEVAPKVLTILASKISLNATVAFRWVVYETKDDFLDGVIDMLTAKTMTDFKKCVEKFSSPHASVLYAHINGDIGYQAVGRVPDRKYYGLEILEGWNGEYEWEGIIPFKEMPYVMNPEKGYIVSANNRIIARNYKHYYGIGHEFADARAERISELIEGLIKSKVLVTSKEMVKIGLDTLNIYARNMLPVMLNILKPDYKISRAIEALENWDYRMTKESVPAHIFAVWFREILFQLISDELGDEDLIRSVMRSPWYRNTVASLFSTKLYENSTRAKFCDNIHTPEVENCEQLLYRTLEKVGNITEPWGNVHQTHLKHVPLTKAPVLNKVFDMRIPEGGIDITPLANLFDWSSDNFVVSHGPVYKMIVDLDENSASMWGIDAGQSGHVLSKHYVDQARRFVEGNLLPWQFRYIPANTQQIVLTNKQVPS